MKLGTETNSVINHLHARGTLGQPKPVVGMGATILAWTDRYAATIVSVEEIGGSKRYRWLIGVQRDRGIVVSGSIRDGSAVWGFEANPKASIELYASAPGDGPWKRVERNAKGRLVLSPGNGLRIGERDEYRDPSF